MPQNIEVKELNSNPTDAEIKQTIDRAFAGFDAQMDRLDRTLADLQIRMDRLEAMNGIRHSGDNR